MQDRTVWDVVEEVVTRTREAPIASVIATSAVTMLFCAIAPAALRPACDSMVTASSDLAIIERVRIQRRDNIGKTRICHDETDTRIGVSTGRLAELATRVLKPTQAEDAEGEPFFL
jgi:hypothetical protein